MENRYAQVISAGWGHTILEKEYDNYSNLKEDRILVDLYFTKKDLKEIQKQNINEDKFYIRFVFDEMDIQVSYKTKNIDNAENLIITFAYYQEKERVVVPTELN